MIKIGNTNPHAINLETQGIMLQLPSEAPDGKVVLPRNPTLHDISQTYVAAYCKLTGTRAPELHMDYWDKGLTKSGKEDVIRAVDIDALRGLSLPLQQAALSLLVEWHGALDEKLRALKATDGCSGCFGRHANSKAAEDHLSQTGERLRRNVKVESFLQAAQKMDLAALKESIADGMDVNACGNSGSFALIALLENEAPDPETRRKIDECAFYLLSLPRIDPCKDGRIGNAYGAALRGGHDSVAEHLIKTYPQIILRNGHGAAAINMAAQRCPKVLAHLKHGAIILGKLGVQGMVELYMRELAFVQRQNRAPSRAFYLDVMNDITRAHPNLGRMPMVALLRCALIMNDTDMQEAVAHWLRRDIGDDLDSNPVPIPRTDPFSLVIAEYSAP